MDHDGIREDAKSELRYHKYMNDHDLIESCTAIEHAEEQLFEEACKKVIKDYRLVDYFSNIENWKKLTSEQKIDYCKKLLEEDPNDEFPLLRQVDVFQKLVNIDMKNLDYYKILECAFFDLKNYESSNITTSTNIVYNPLIPIGHYERHIRNLYKKSTISKLQIPLANATEYLQQLLNIWYLYKHYNLSYNDVYNRQIEFTEIITIKRNLTSINKLVVKIKEIKKDPPKPLSPDDI